jgi:choline monooxygenase
VSPAWWAQGCGPGRPGPLDLRALSIDPDIRRARTLPAAFYTDSGAWDAAKERLFARSWQLIGDAAALDAPGACVPAVLLPGLLDEPLLLTRPADPSTLAARAPRRRPPWSLPGAPTAADGNAAGSHAAAASRTRARSAAARGNAAHPARSHPAKSRRASAFEPRVTGPVGDARFEAEGIACLSNVCTHRGLPLCDSPRLAAQLQCRYHGRRFALDGRFLGAPEFDAAVDFPGPRDDLPRVALARWGPLLFASLDPAVPFAEWIAPLEQRLGWLPLARARLSVERSRDYTVAAHWALYCDNYLEGFHIPWVHPGLAGALDCARYRTELFERGNLQVGIAGGGDVPVFAQPAGARDAGEAVAGYYFWLFPNTMVNAYPWGLSLNIVKPVAPDRCTVSFLAYVWDASLLDRGAGAGLDRVEAEDEGVVEAVQRGVRGRLYRGGRYAPEREACVHHFHRLLVDALHAE